MVMAFPTRATSVRSPPRIATASKTTTGARTPTTIATVSPTRATAARTSPRIANGFEDEDGCPDPDNDHDGIADVVDRCPNEAETVNGFEDDDGCPDQPSMRVTGDRIVLDERIPLAIVLAHGLVDDAF